MKKHCWHWGWAFNRTVCGPRSIDIHFGWLFLSCSNTSQGMFGYFDFWYKIDSFLANNFPIWNYWKISRPIFSIGIIIWLPNKFSFFFICKTSYHYHWNNKQSIFIKSLNRCPIPIIPYTMKRMGLFYICPVLRLCSVLGQASRRAFVQGNGLLWK